MGRSTKPYDTSNNKKFRDKNHKSKALKSTETKTENKSEEVDDSKSVLSDLIFTVSDAPARVFASAGACMQVSASENPSSIDTITIEIPKSQVAMLAKKGATLVGHGVNLEASRH